MADAAGDVRVQRAAQDEIVVQLHQLQRDGGEQRGNGQARHAIPQRVARKLCEVRVGLG